MANEVWKEYDANPVTHSAAHYLMTIRGLLQDRGYARVTDIAREMGITRGSCSISLKALKKRGLVNEDENKFMQLSEEGERLAAIVENNDQILESFLRDLLGVDAEQAEIDACKIEHLLSIETSMQLAAFVHFLNSDRKAVQAFIKAFRRDQPRCLEDVSRCELAGQPAWRLPVRQSPAPRVSAVGRSAKPSCVCVILPMIDTPTTSA